MSEPPTKQKQITLPLPQFLEILWAWTDKISISDNLASLISAIDPDEQFCHIEFPEDLGRCVHPRVWRVKDWKTDYAVYVKNKEQAAKDRVRANIFSENRKRLCAKLMSMTGMTEDQVQPLAERMLKRNCVELMKRELGVYIEEYPKE